MTTTNTTIKATELPEKRSLIIDCDALPFVPKGWSVARHIQTGQLDWSKEFDRKADRRTAGGKGFGERDREDVFNANVLDWLLKAENQDLVPVDWQRDANGYIRTMFFWGTLYRNEGGNLCVRVMHFTKTRKWDWSYVWIGC